MNSDQIFQIIEQIAAEPSKNGKIALIAQHKDDADFSAVLKAAYDPMITYGMASVPEVDSNGEATFTFVEVLGLYHIVKLLDDMASRSLTGNAAKAMVENFLNVLSSESGELLKRIIKKDLRAGINESSINKAIKGLIPEFPYMRCCLPKDAKLEKFSWEDGVFSQEKADGMFVNINHEGSGLIRITSRNGTEIPLYHIGQLASAVERVLAPDTQTHGEALVFRNGVCLPREESNGIMNSVAQGGALSDGDEVRVLVWDQIPLGAVEPKGKVQRPYRERFTVLAKQVRAAAVSPISVIPTRLVRSLPEAYAHYGELLALGKEGTIIKHGGAIWRDGTSKEQVKLKLEVNVELRVKAFLPGNGKNEATFGSILCESDCGQLEVGVSGFKDSDRLSLWGKRDELIGSIMTVAANGLMHPKKEGKLHSLFLPRFVEFRHDKHEADDLQRIIDQFDAAIKVA